MCSERDASGWLDNSVSGEVFEFIIECELCLRGYTLAEGYDIIRVGAGSKNIPGRCGSISFMMIKQGMTVM
jgi:hypothetical protein